MYHIFWSAQRHNESTQTPEKVKIDFITLRIKNLVRDFLSMFVG
jgi:hypothetical protein